MYWFIGLGFFAVSTAMWSWSRSIWNSIDHAMNSEQRGPYEAGTMATTCVAILTGYAGLISTFTAWDTPDRRVNELTQQVADLQLVIKNDQDQISALARNIGAVTIAAQTKANVPATTIAQSVAQEPQSIINLDEPKPLDLEQQKTKDELVEKFARSLSDMRTWKDSVARCDREISAETTKLSHIRNNNPNDELEATCRTEIARQKLERIRCKQHAETATRESAATFTNLTLFLKDHPDEELTTYLRDIQPSLPGELTLAQQK